MRHSGPHLCTHFLCRPTFLYLCSGEKVSTQLQCSQIDLFLGFFALPLKLSETRRETSKNRRGSCNRGWLEPCAAWNCCFYGFWSRDTTFNCTHHLLIEKLVSFEEFSSSTRTTHWICFKRYFRCECQFDILGVGSLPLSRN